MTSPLMRYDLLINCLGHFLNLYCKIQAAAAAKKKCCINFYLSKKRNKKVRKLPHSMKKFRKMISCCAYMFSLKHTHTKIRRKKNLIIFLLCVSIQSNCYLHISSVFSQRNYLHHHRKGIYRTTEVDHASSFLSQRLFLKFR